MTVYFVGLHYKPGMSALDSRSLAGKRIDMIIERLPKGIEVVKTNLHPTNEMPEKWIAERNHKTWQLAYNPQDNDLIFLLGGKVQKDFRLKHNGVVLFSHPSKVMSKYELENYVSTAVKIVNDKINNQ